MEIVWKGKSGNLEQVSSRMSLEELKMRVPLADIKEALKIQGHEYGKIQLSLLLKRVRDDLQGTMPDQNRTQLPADDQEFVQWIVNGLSLLIEEKIIKLDE